MAFRSDIERQLSEIFTQLEEFRQELRYLKRQVSLLNGRRRGPDPIPKPRNVNAMSNIARCLRQEINRLNQNRIRRNQEIYDQFPGDDLSINRELKSIIGNLLRSRLPQMYGKYTWYHACRSQYANVCEEIILQASEMQEFYVLTQTANMWAIRLIADSKMRTALRDASDTQNIRGRNNFSNGDITNELQQTVSNEEVTLPANPVAAARRRRQTTMSSTIREVVTGHLAVVNNLNNSLPNDGQVEEPSPENMQSMGRSGNPHRSPIINDPEAPVSPTNTNNNSSSVPRLQLPDRGDNRIRGIPIRRVGISRRRVRRGW